MDGSGERELFRATRSVGVPAVSPDNSRLAVLADSERGAWAVFTVPTGGGQATEVYRQPDRSLMPTYRYPLWSKDGKHIFIATKPPKGKSSVAVENVFSSGSTTRRELAWPQRAVLACVQIIPRK
jgi:Tol biopolymer transport system component